MQCPKCSRQVTDDVKQCECGYQFHILYDRSQAPADGIDPGAYGGAQVFPAGIDKKTMSAYRSAFILLYFIGGLNALLWVLSVILPDSEILQTIGISMYSIVFGALLLGCAVFVQRKSAAALITAIVLLALDTVAGLVLSMMFGDRVNVGGLIVRGLFVVALLQGIKAIKKLREHARMERMASSGV